MREPSRLLASQQGAFPGTYPPGRYKNQWLEMYLTTPSDTILGVRYAKGMQGSIALTFNDIGNRNGRARRKLFVYLKRQCGMDGLRFPFKQQACRSFEGKCRSAYQ